MDLNRSQQKLATAAVAARNNAYSRYSGFSVGSAVRTASGNVHHGCNVENSSYGLTMCAERNAIAAAVAEGMQPGELAAIAVFGGTESITPCGACRQVIAEFAADQCEVICVGENGAGRVYSLGELLPDRFSLDD